MTVYELIQELVQYPADAKMTFKVGSMTTDDILWDSYHYAAGDEVIMELD